MIIPLNLVCFVMVCAGYIIYPVWLLPALPPAGQAALFFSFCAIAAAALYSPLKEVRITFPGGLASGWKEVLTSWLLLLPLWAPFFLLPVPTGEDEQSHAGAAAWVLGQISAWPGLPMPVLHFLAWTALLTLGLLMFRKKTDLTRISPVKVQAAVFPFLVIYVFFAMRYGLAAKLGQWESIYEYPALSRYMYAAVYSLFGIHEILPRLVQAACVSATGLLLAKTVLLTGERPSRPFFILGTALFPAFFWLSTTPDLEGGTIMFFAAVTFFYSSFAVNNDRAHGLTAIFILTLGFFYRQFFVGQVLALGSLSAFFAWTADSPEKRAANLDFIKNLWIPLLIGLPYIIISRGTGVKPDFNPEILARPALLLQNFSDMPKALGTAALCLSAAGLIYTLAFRRSKTALIVIVTALTYQLMISMTIGSGYVRHAAPFYLGAAFFLLFFVTCAARRLPGRAALAAQAAVLLLLGWKSLAAPVFQYRNLTNLYDGIFPYEQAMKFIASREKRPKIYAPMEAEPSHFYLAKTGLAGKVIWGRGLPRMFSAETAKKNFFNGGFDLMLLPYIRGEASLTDFARITDELTASGEFRSEKVFDYHGNKLVLLKPASRAPGAL